MDGNGRWAKRRFLPRLEGHRAGAKSVRKLVEESRRLGIRYLTLFAFSTENWSRPRDEVSGLMELFAKHLISELELMLNNNIRLRALGDLERLPDNVRQELSRVIESTSANDGMDLILAVSYGGRAEIVHAARAIAQDVASGKFDPALIDEVLFSRYLYLPDVPDPDLLIRTSSEHRVSNFLLWELAYTEIVVSSVLWPDFSIAEFHQCLAEFSKRTRRFGLTGEQLDELPLQGNER